MSTIFKPTRTMGPEKGTVFFAMPFGVKKLSNGEDFDFDLFYTEECVPVVRDECGMQPVRVDGIYGSGGVLETVWRAMQQAELVVVDFTTHSANVAFEFGWALILGKRVAVITQDPEDIPSDVRGVCRYIAYSDKASATRRMREELALQLKALADTPSEEMAPMPMPGCSMTSVAARVILAERDYVVVQDERGRRGVMGNGDVEYSRFIKDMAKRFPVGTPLDGAFVVDPERAEMRYTLLGGQTNPWSTLAGRFTTGTRFRSCVESAREGIGAFVRVAEGVNGLVPQQQFAGPLPLVGDELEVIVTKVDKNRRRIDLRLVQAGNSSRGPGRFATQGWQGDGTVVKAVPEANGRGGYVLLDLPDTDRPALLLVKHMTADLRADLNNGHVETGELIRVEVVSVDTARGKTLLRELPEPSEQLAA